MSKDLPETLLGYPVKPAGNLPIRTAGDIVLGGLADYITMAIKSQADHIREQLEGCMLLGHPLNMDDIDSLIVAVYGLAQAERYHIDNANTKPRRRPD